MVNSLRWPWLAATVLTAALGAQRTWVVDRAGGTGVDFTNLPAAFAAVRDGDRVVVRAGTYDPGRLDKAAQVVGEPGALVVITRSTGPFEITGISAGRSCSVRGFEVRSSLDHSGVVVRVHANPGLVCLADLLLRVQMASPSLQVTDCAAVTLSGSTVLSRTFVERSTFTASGSSFQSWPYPSGPPGSAIAATEAALELTQCSAFGSSGGGHFFGSPAITLWTSALLLRGDGNCFYLGGTYNTQPAAPSIEGSANSTLVVDPAVVLTPAPRNLLSVTPLRLPALTARLTPNTLDLDLYSPAGHAHALFAALPSMPLLLPPFGVHWLDLPSTALLQVGLQGAGEHTLVSFPRNHDPSLRGQALAFQALSGGSLPSLALSNPAIIVVP